MDAQQVDKIVAAILAVEATRQANAGAPAGGRDIAGEIWDYYTHFSARLSDVRAQLAGRTR